ncbi:hypothetical protein PSAC2689_130082 [Paraburkholderia sacchari]|uniref:hypothetical protein n=1 Tax=Paraburkholderia sacchari TaxID=159450 RepID=UPI0039A7140D
MAIRTEGGGYVQYNHLANGEARMEGTDKEERSAFPARTIPNGQPLDNPLLEK